MLLASRNFSYFTHTICAFIVVSGGCHGSKDRMPRITRCDLDASFFRPITLINSKSSGPDNLSQSNMESKLGHCGNEMYTKGERIFGSINVWGQLNTS